MTHISLCQLNRVMRFLQPFLAFLLLSVTQCHALSIGGIHPYNLGIDISSNQGCSRTCESDNCSLPPLLKYGKYCGIMYSGCPGEKPCDSLDACCMVHDACVTNNNNDYLNMQCNQNLLNCIKKVNTMGSTFQGNTCSMSQVAQEITLIIDAAVLAGKALHKP